VTFEEVLSAGGHKDATMHVGGHGEPWPDIKVIVITRDDQTYVCVRREGVESVTIAHNVREGLELFALELRTAISKLPE
jgi:hypothetical protein